MNYYLLSQSITINTLVLGGHKFTCYTHDFWEFRKFKLSLNIDDFFKRDQIETMLPKWDWTVQCQSLLFKSLLFTIKEFPGGSTGSPHCKLGVENSMSEASLLAYWLCSLYSCFPWICCCTCIYCFPMVFTKVQMFSVPQLKPKMWTEGLFMSLKVGIVLVSTSLLFPFWSGAIPQTHLRRQLLRPFREG